MLRRANTVVTRARERIRTAAEHDPHAWPERDDDRAILVHDDDEGSPEDGAAADHDAAAAEHEGNGASRPPLGSPEPRAPDLHRPLSPGRGRRPPLGSPEPGAPDLDGPLSPGGVSGPPTGGRPHPLGARTTRLLTDRTAASADGAVPMGLRTAAAWSWRLIVVLVGLYSLIYA